MLGCTNIQCMQGLGGGGLVIAVAVAVVIAVAVCWRREHVGDQVQVSCEKGMGGPSFENCVQIIDFHSSGAWGETAWDHVRLGPWAHEHESMRLIHLLASTMAPLRAQEGEEVHAHQDHL